MFLSGLFIIARRDCSFFVGGGPLWQSLTPHVFGSRGVYGGREGGFMLGG